jgi:hypothetical protein
LAIAVSVIPLVWVGYWVAKGVKLAGGVGV